MSDIEYDSIDSDGPERTVSQAELNQAVAAAEEAGFQKGWKERGLPAGVEATIADATAKLREQVKIREDRIAEQGIIINNMERERDEAVRREVAKAKLEGALDVLLQIRSFRKQHPMDVGLIETLEFIGNLYHQYQNAAERLNSGDAK